MSQTSETGRPTPYEMVFGAERFSLKEFPAVAEEARERDLTVSSREAFALLAQVGVLLEQLVPDETEPAAIDRYLDILFHAFHLWQGGCRIYSFDEPVVRSLIESAPDIRNWQPRVPASAFYIELPRNLFWASVTEGQPPEPVEGMFVKPKEEAPASRADILLVLGMWPDRPGFSVAQLAADLEASFKLVHADAFKSDVPGAERAGLYSLQLSSEAALLLARLLWYLDAHPASLERVKRGSTRGSCSFQHYRVRLVQRSAG